MAKRFLIVFGLALLYLASLSLILMLVTVLLGDHQTAMLIVLLTVLAVSLGGLIPFLSWAVRRVFAFQGEGKPVPLETLRSQIQAINAFDSPVMVEQQNGKLVVSWRHADPNGHRPAVIAGPARSYQLHITFDEARHTVTMLDRAESPSLNGDSESSAEGRSTVQGVIMAHEVSKKWGIRRNFEQSPVSGYQFVPTEIKLPILNSILRNGWDVRYGIW